MSLTPLRQSGKRMRPGYITVLILALWASHSAAAQAPKGATYVGSANCRSCHIEAYDGWKQTRMARVVSDPKEHPDAVLADFSKSDPLVKFSMKDVAFVYGSRWKQRFFTKLGDDYFVQAAQWDVAKKRWLPYHVEAGTDWWIPFYGQTNEERPTGPLCDGCHSVNYNVATRKVTEWNVGCEKCHGPGSEHVAHPTRTNIVNPETLDAVRANDTCIQCHSQGQPIEGAGFNNAGGKHYDWPVGFTPGESLAKYWKLEDLKIGTTNFYQYADLTGHKNRMQGNDFIQSTMYHRGLRCFDCHEVHSNENKSNLIAVGNQVCLKCHAKSEENLAGLRGTVAEHTHHAEGSPGSECVACHMPKIETTIKENFVSAHTFRFITPALTEQNGVPNPCTSCHKDKSNAWAAKELQGWSTVSPWRMTQPLM
ncbi:MAG: cytochrome c family protein [Acidobacteriaceae bacterium]|nr:cytochrome c family protein [Acidobacteriaceae bacterium]